MKEIIKQYIDMMEQILHNANNHHGMSLDISLRPDKASELRDEGARITIRRLTNKPEYQALKAVLSMPVSEDKLCVAAPMPSYAYGSERYCKYCSEEITHQGQICRTVGEGKCKCDVNGFVDINCPKCGWKGCKQPTDTQDNDGWIKHDGKKQPVPDGTQIEVRFTNGDTSTTRNAEIWDWQWRSRDYDIIAYRIIDEPKGEKKQTLLEWAQDIGDNLDIYTPYEIISLLSDYLEQNK